MTVIKRDSEMGKSAQELLDTAMEFWLKCNKAKQYGAVQWLQGKDGELIIFTRGEYRQRLLNNIETLPGVSSENVFGDELEQDEE